MGLDTIVFGKKKVSDIMKEIYDNSRNKKEQISALVGELQPLVENIGDATLVVPMIKEYLEVGVKNDEHLIKLVALVQRLEGGNRNSESEYFNPEELAKLMEQSEELGKQLDKQQDS